MRGIDRRRRQRKSFTDGPFGLAMRRLATIDLSAGHQPLSYADELLAGLRRRGFRDRWLDAINVLCVR